MKKISIGSTELVSFGKRAVDVPAKIDTGADSSAIWASNICVTRDGVLKFSLFGEGSQYYNGKVFRRTDYEAALITSSNGASEIRYRTTFSIAVGGKKIRARFYLSDRSKNKFPVLIGRRALRGKFVVDVAKGAVSMVKENKLGINAELKKDPYKFYKRYIVDGGKKWQR